MRKKKEDTTIILIQNRKVRKVMKIKAIFFDMDGLVLDTEKLYTRFWQEAGLVMGYPMTKQHALGMRSLNRDAGLAKMKSYFGESVDYDGTRQKRIELMEAFIQKEGVEVKPGLDVLLHYYLLEYQHFQCYLLHQKRFLVIAMK